jgi:hypothetical protein
MFLRAVGELKTDLVRTEESMNTAFRFWNANLQDMSAKMPRLYRLLLLELQDSLARPNNLDPETDTGKQAIYMWIENLLLSPSWLQFRSTINMNDIYAQLIESNLLSPTVWTHRLSKVLLENSNDAFRQDWKSQYQASIGNLDTEGAIQEADDSPLFQAESTNQHQQNGGWRPYEGVWTPRPIGQL